MSTAAIVIGVVGLSVVALAGASSSKKSNKLRPDQTITGFPVDLPRLTYLLGGCKNGCSESELAERQGLVDTARSKFEARRKVLPSDASVAQDKYSKQKFVLPVQAGTGSLLNELTHGTGSVDEFGRYAAGLPSNFGKTLLVVAQQVAPLIPGIGSAAGAALAYAIAIGQGKSQKDAILAAARGALPVQYQLAFDLGVGVMSGESVTDTAKKALFNQYPGSETYYNQARTLAKGRV